MKRKSFVFTLFVSLFGLGLTGPVNAEDFVLKSPNELVNELTAEDLENAVGADGFGEREHHVEMGPAVPFAFKQRASFQNVNSYIQKNNFPNPPISRDARFGTTYVSNYKQNRPIGVVVHETANPGSTINGEVNFMFNNQHNAFVHAFTDSKQIIETAPTEYLAWGAGPKANPYYMHIELVQEKTFDGFARSVNNDAYWIARQLYSWGLPVVSAEKTGTGTVISHYSVSMFLGGTNHVDPIGYFAQWGYTMDEFIQLIEIKYNAIQSSDKQNAKITELTDLKQTRRIVNNSYSMYTLPNNTPGATYVKPLSSVNKVNDNVNLTKLVKTSDGVKVYQIDNGLYVDYRAFKEPATVVKEEKINRRLKVKDDGYSIFSEPAGTEYSKSLGVLRSKHKKNEVVKVTRYAETSEKNKSYYIESTGWVSTSALEEPAIITKQETINKKMKVRDAGYSVFTRPNQTENAQRKGALKDYHAKDNTVVLTEYAETDKGAKVYNVKGTGWVDTRAFSEFAEIAVKQELNEVLRVRDAGYSVYSKPFNTENYKRKGSLHQFYPNNSQVKITQYAETNEGAKVYYIDSLGWVDTRAFVTLDEITKENDLGGQMFKVLDDGYSVFTAPNGTKGSERKGTLRQFYKTHQEVSISKYAETSGNVKVYYIDKVGWVDTRAFKEFDMISHEETLDNQILKVRDAGYSVYSTPNGTIGSERKGSLAQYYPKDSSITVSRYAETSKNAKVYYIDKVGWVDTRAFVEFDTITFEEILENQQVRIIDAGYSVYSTPNGTIGSKRIGSLAQFHSKNSIINVTKYAETSENAKVYYIEEIGWVDIRAFEKIVSFSEPISELSNIIDNEEIDIIESETIETVTEKNSTMSEANQSSEIKE